MYGLPWLQMTAWLGLVALLSGAPEFLKGQLHLHTGNSGDSATPPADVVRWYAARGYDFIVVTDHNFVTVAPGTPSMLVIPGAELTQNVDRCEPPPPPGMRCLLHVNALFVTPPRDGKITWAGPVGPARLAIYRRALATSRLLGGIAQLNHPNFHHAADAALITTLAREGLTLLEIANRSWDSNDVPAEAGRPTTEAIWDQALTAGANVFGTATDDAHHYVDAAAAGARGQPVFPGDLGFVMVRAARRPGAIRDALTRGDFYASTGVLLARVDRTPERLEIEVDARSPGSHRFAFIGSGGRVLARAEGRRASFRLLGARGGYVRAVVDDARGRRAWVQPLRVP
jgi:hypothetical protein